MSNGVATTLRALFDAIARWEPSLAGRLSRMGTAEPIDARPGLEQLAVLHAVTSGEIVAPNAMPLGVCGGLQLLGREGCIAARAAWGPLERVAGDVDAIAMPGGRYRSVPPGAVRDVYFSMGWFPVLAEPFEANYVAVDSTPGPAGHAGQMVIVGRDEETHTVVAPDLTTLLEVLRAQVEAGEWELVAASGPRQPAHVRHREGRLASVLARRAVGAP